MEQAQFDTLEEKINLALKIIHDLKEQNQSLKDQLDAVQEKCTVAESGEQEKTAEIERLNNDCTQKTEQISQAADKLQALIDKLDNEKLEVLTP